MISSKFGHMQINIKPASLGFYHDLFTFLGWAVLYQDEQMVGVGAPDGGSLWFSGYETKDVANDYDGVGMNHLAISVPEQGNVDEAVAYLAEHNVPALFETPRHRPEFSHDGDTYYQVMFESPDKILFEVVYTGPKA